MGTIPNATLITLMDSLASGKLIFDNALGLTGTEADTTSKAAQNDDVTLAAVADADVLSDLIPAYTLRAATLLAANLYATLGAYNLWWALDKHLGGMDQYLRDQNIRVSTHVQQIGFPLSAEQIMPPAVDPMATFAVTGSGTGTYTHVADIDTTQYGRAWLDAVVTSAIGANAISATITGVQIDNTTVTSKQVTIAANSSVGTTVHVGTLGVQADSYDSLTNISITGGTSGDAFKVVSRVERTITAVS